MAVSTCTACGEIFNSVGGFDKHRIGTYEPNTRRCMTTDEMIDAGFDLNKYDRWVMSLMDEAAVERRNQKTAVTP